MFSKFKREGIRMHKGEKVNLLEVKFHYSNGFTTSVNYWVDKGELPPYKRLAKSAHIYDYTMEKDGVYYRSTNYTHFTIENIGEGELLKNVDWQYWKANEISDDVVRKLN